MVRKHGLAEVTNILNQYYHELRSQGRDKTVVRKKIGQWFSCQLKLVGKQLQEGRLLDACCLLLVDAISRYV